MTEESILIQRWTDVSPLMVMFHPGASIKAQDLNDNFEQPQLAIEDGRCKVPQWFYDWIERNLIRITEEQNRAGDWQWEGTLDDDDHFATSAALNDRFQPFWQALLLRQVLCLHGGCQVRSGLTVAIRLPSSGTKTNRSGKYLQVMEHLDNVVLRTSG